MEIIVQQDGTFDPGKILVQENWVVRKVRVKKAWYLPWNRNKPSEYIMIYEQPPETEK